MQEKEKDIELRSEDVQDVMGQVPPAILRWGITVIALVVLLLLVGCFIFKYPDTLTGKATLTTEVPPANILARASGKIDKLYVVNNQQVKAGTMPVCKMLLPAQGSGKVVVGQRANVRLNNFPDQEFGYLEGRVEHISDTPDPDGMYVVEIRFPKGLVTNYGVKLPITRQMQGSAEIITEDVRLIVRFFNPIKKLLLKYT